MKILKIDAHKSRIKLILLIFAAMIGSAILCLLFNIWHDLRYSEIMDSASWYRLVLQTPVWKWGITAVFLFITFPILKKYKKEIGDFLYRYRFFIAVLLWIFCILFKINGTSTACWGKYFNEDVESRGLLMGTSRMIRSDEWAIYTPMMLSQQYNPDGPYPYFSTLLRGTATDTFIVYGLPVKDPAVLFRPFHWGFLFLGAERGFSFYWCGRIIALALVSFELGMLITKNNKLYAYLISLFITLAPTVQWWIGVNGLVEMLVFGQLAVLLVYHYMHTESFRVRLCIGLLLVICAGGYILVFYPAWQVPMAYIILGLLIWVLISCWKEFRFRPQKDIPILLGCFLLLGIGMGYIFLKSSDTINTVMNTAYPGKRIDCGGGDFFEMLRYGGNFFFPVISETFFTPEIAESFPTNYCELATFISFAPLGFLLALFALFREKKADSLLVILLGVDIFLNVYCLAGYPEFFAKITLLSHATSGRVTQIIGIIDILLLFRALSLPKMCPRRPAAFGFGILFAALLSLFNRKIYGPYLSTFCLAGLVFLLCLGCFLLLRSSKKAEKYAAAVFFSLFMFVAGGLVNPIQHGFDVIYDTDLMREVRSIVDKDPKGIWICDNFEYLFHNYFIMGGAPTIDSIHTYPAMECWRTLDPDGEYEEIYNRYAHFTTMIEQKDTAFSLIFADSIMLHLNADDLRTLNVSYVASNRELEEFNTETVNFEQIAGAGDIKIFKVKQL